MKSFITLSLLVLSPLMTLAQSESSPGPNTYKLQKKGDYFIHWGWNRSWYANSDIRFQGPGYDFTLHKATARDRQSELGWDYINPKYISIPQFNFRAGYFISDKYSISVGWDHMKYVLDVPQSVRISGTISPEISEPGLPTNVPSGDYSGINMNKTITLQPDMLTFEHTDGLNYAAVEVERYDDLWQSKRHQKIGLTAVTGLGAGGVVPRSDVRLFGEGLNNYWNLAGWGVSAKAGLKLNLLSWLYLQSDVKVGHIGLTKIRTTGRNDKDKASQNIKYFENYWVFGVRF